jgi:phage terminase small subunit
MLVVNLHSFFEDLQENQEEMVLQVVQALQVVQENQEKMALQEVQEEMAETEEMVHREPEVF